MVIKNKEKSPLLLNDWELFKFLLTQDGFIAESKMIWKPNPKARVNKMFTTIQNTWLKTAK